tara:strand:+ start:295 stop:717 length:423 start_codon:yes stop_codon:yes gene_type:complete
MKKSDLVRIIREVVKREVRSALNEQFGAKKHIKQKSITKKESVEQFSSDPVLNEVLQQTAGEWATMGNRELNSTDAMAGKAGLASMMGLESPEQAFGQPTIQQMLPTDRKHVDVNPELEHALTKDYSKLMKAIDKKKQNK